MTGAYPVLHLGLVRSTRPWARAYLGTPASVPEARRFVGELLAGCPARETLMTCVSEFCANAIAHTASGRGGVFTVEVDCPREGIARVAVTDDGGMSLPVAGSGDLMAEGGRGLAMVAACTSRWGFCEAYPGRTVWAEASWPVAVPSPDRPRKIIRRARRVSPPDSDPRPPRGGTSWPPPGGTLWPPRGGTSWPPRGGTSWPPRGPAA